jgi:site-specific DNA-methyltransferase (adenine-specific)
MSDHTEYSYGGHTVILGDALAALDEHVQDASVDLVFADPPYNIGKQFGEFRDRWDNDEAYAVWCARWIDICVRKLKAAGTLYVMTSTQAMPYLDLHVRQHLTVLSRIVWCYDSSGVQARRRFGSLYEPILHAVKDPKNYTFNAGDITIEAKTGKVRKLIDYRKPKPTLYSMMKVPGNVWFFPRVRYRMDEYEEHPSQKPEALVERIIRASSNLGDMVLDPFAGTFTTSAVAQRLGRRSIGIELQRDYAKIGLRRLGIASELDGEPLTRPAKTCIRRNGRHRSRVATADSPALFAENQE